MVNPELSRQLRKLFSDYQKNTPTNDSDAFDEAQFAILNVIQAMQGLVSVEKIIAVCGGAKSPNAVSRALRNRLPDCCFR